MGQLNHTRLHNASNLPLRLGIGIHEWREATNFDVGNIAANGGILASDTTPILSAINGATDGAQILTWASSNVDQIITQLTIPYDMPPTKDFKFKLRARMGGATDTPLLTIDTFFDEGDTKVVDTTDAITGITYAEYTATIGNADFPKGARSLTIGVTPAAHGTDTLIISVTWLEYTSTRPNPKNAGTND